MIDEEKLVDAYLYEQDWRVRENANKLYGYGGLKAYLAESVIARYALKKVYGEEAMKAHVNGDIHIHDLGHLTVYCGGYGVDKVIANGINGISGMTWSRAPRHFSSAVGQIMNFVFMIQQEQAGAVGLNCFDTYLAPFVRYDGLSYKEVKQALQEFIYSINMPMRAGLETPFTNITFDGAVREDLRDKHVIADSEIKSETYGDFEEELLMIDKAIMELMYEGDAKGRVFTFPITTVNITRGFDWDGEFAEWVCKITAKYGIPYFQNMMGSNLRPEDVMAFCCRLKADLKKAKRYGGVFGNPDATGSVGVVTINMPRIALLNGNRFFDVLDERLELVREILNRRREVVQKLMDRGMYPFIKRFLGHLNWHFNTVSIVGMHEALMIAGVEDGICSEDGMHEAEQILKHITKRIAEFEEGDNVMWNFEQAPAESASGRLKDKDIKKFGKMRIPYGTMSYTNSTHVPVNYTDDLWWVLKHQERMNEYYSGGSVVHIWLGEAIDDETVKVLVDKICRKTKIPYFSITPTFSVCAEHGYLSGENWKCPTCGSDCEVYSRVVGYLKPVQNWNDWKRNEFLERVTFKV